jgi:Tfp pilus assembly major pilin PilA
MKKSTIRSLVQAACVIAVLTAVAVPLSNVMVAKGTVADATLATDTDVVELSQSAETTSAISALMAGSAVGPSRGAVVDPRHPATAFVP